jgi:hypothetical protein
MNSFDLHGQLTKSEKGVTGIHNLDRDILRRKVLEVYDRDEFATPKKLDHEIRAAVGCAGSSRSMQRIREDTGFKYAKCNDSGKWLVWHCSCEDYVPESKAQNWKTGQHTNLHET